MNGSHLDESSSFFGLALSTHRVLLQQNNTTTTAAAAAEASLSSSASFPYEALIGAIAIFFFRYTVRIQKREPLLLRCFFCFLLAALAYLRKSYELVIAVEIFSYVVTWLLLKPIPTQYLRQHDNNNDSNNGSNTGYDAVLIRLLMILAGAVVSMLVAHSLVGSTFWKLIRLITPNVIYQTLEYLFPISEMKNAYKIMYDLALEKDLYEQMIQHLLFVTFHIQCGMGYLGIDFLRKEQDRRNQIIRLDVATSTDEEDNTNQGNNNADAAKEGNGKKVGKRSISKTDDQIMERSRKFQRSAAPFIFFTALPYMSQIIIYGNINQFAFSCVQDEMHRTVRFRQVFEHDNHLTAMANDSPTSPEAYATSANTVVSTAYDIFNRKLFSLPKVLMLPAVMSKQPMLIVQVFPFIFLSDWFKASLVSFMTTKIENMQKEIQELTAIRSKVESFDIKNAELLQRSGKGATQFTQRRWEELTVKVQSRVIVSDLLSRSKGFFAFMQRNFVFTVLIDCALANLIAIGKIVTSDIFVFSRAIEDAVDMVLMRSRSEAELARMMTEIEKLEKLNALWENSKEPNLLRCNLASSTGRSIESRHHKKVVVIRNLHYSRGTAQARADHLEIPSGVYALTGANGSGKSTLFRILMSCHTNEKSIDLPSSIHLLTPAEPMIEDDDILRETACMESDDEQDNDDSCEVSDPVDPRSLKEDDVSVIEDVATGPEAQHHIPKLSITMPSSEVFEISQNFYWPLYSKPIDWIYQEHVSETCDSENLQQRLRLVAEELHSLQFFQSGQTFTSDASKYNETVEDETKIQPYESDAKGAEKTIKRIMSELEEEKEDWFSDLSGGQKSKVELVRTVFLRQRCPDVLLVDETMAPLDPASKELVMAKLKLFCNESIIIVIYHTDVGQGKQIEGKLVDCVPSNNFFDRNIHLERGIVHLRDTC